MILKKIQHQLETLYHFSLDYDVEQFLTTQHSLPKNGGAVGHRLRQEALLIKYSQEGLELGLFIAKNILTDLQKNDPYRDLGMHNLNAFLITAEGVSHFLYFVRRAQEGWPVTQLEMELQAEVDKYLLASLLFFEQKGKVPSFLFSYLFENFQWAESLSETESRRYTEANHLATRFCSHLEQDCIRCGRWREALKRARQFYHLNHWAKIRALTP